MYKQIICSMLVLLSGRVLAQNSDVVLESTVKEIKSAPSDAAQVVGDGVKFIGDESAAAARGVRHVFSGKSPHMKTRRAAVRKTARAWNPSDEIIFRSYSVSKAVGETLTMGNPVPPGRPVDISGVFSGVDFPEGTSVYYRSDFHRLFVRQTQKNLLRIEDILADMSGHILDRKPEQVEVEAKFLEIGQHTLDELGFTWTFNDFGGEGLKLFDNLSLPTGQTLFGDGLRTGADTDSLAIQRDGSLDWSALIHAVQQEDDTDVLSAPRVVTRSGRTAKILAGEERMVPQEFKADSMNTSVYVEHGGWKSDLVGVQLEVTPELRADGRLIDLELEPKIMDLLGYDEYAVTPENASMIIWARRNANQNAMDGRFPIVTKLVDGTESSVGKIYNAVIGSVYTNGTDVNDIGTIAAATGNNGNRAFPLYGYFSSGRALQHDTDGIPVPSVQGRLPYFRVREVKTRVTVADGGTVGLGGLIYDKLETRRDKIPVLGSIPVVGKLFRSVRNKRVKRNLIILVRASNVSPRGEYSANASLLN